jgi:hypothetical protein
MKPYDAEAAASAVDATVHTTIQLYMLMYHTKAALLFSVDEARVAIVNFSM